MISSHKKTAFRRFFVGSFNEPLFFGLLYRLGDNRCGQNLFINRFAEFTAVEGIQHDLLEFSNQRITWVSTGTLVVKGVFRQLVYFRQEIGFQHAGFAD